VSGGKIVAGPATKKENQADLKNLANIGSLKNGSILATTPSSISSLS
jgi:hypothetical protein